MMPSVVRALAVASIRPGFSSRRAAAPAPRSLYETQRVSSTWLTAAVATPTAAEAPAMPSPTSSTASEPIMAAARTRRGHATPVHPLHHDAEPVQHELLAGARHSPEHRVDQPPDGRDVGVLEGPPQGLREVVEAGPPVHDEAAAVAADRGWSFHVVLVADLSDDLLEAVLPGH